MTASQLIRLPRLGETMESGRIVLWLKQPGEAFRRGETLAEIETDKTTVEMPALSDGVIIEHLVAVDEIIDIGTPIARYRNTKDTVAANAEPAEPPGTELTDKQPLPFRQRAAPAARALARRHGVTLEEVTGSGPRGRITSSDVKAYSMRNEYLSPISSGITERSQITERLVTLGKQQIYCKLWHSDRPSSLPPLVLLHGFGGAVDTWTATAKALQRHGRNVIAIDLPGHGQTQAADTDTVSINRIAELLIDVMPQLDITDLELVGHSMGGAIAVAMAAAPGLALSRLALIAPIGLGNMFNQAFLDNLLAAETADELRPILQQLTVHPLLSSAQQLAATLGLLQRHRDTLKRVARNIAINGVQQIDISRPLAELAMPVRIIAGRNDAIIPWQQMLQAPTQAALHFMTEAGHMPHWDQPRTVVQVLLQ